VKGIAEFVMRGPVNAGAVAAGTLLLGLVVAPFAWLSAAVVALVALRLGAFATLRVAGPALAGVALAGALVTGQGAAIAVSGLVAWLPAMVLALVLRQRVRLDDALLVACAIGWALVFGTYLFVEDPTGLWRDLLHRIMPPEAMAARFELSAEAVRQMIDAMAPLMTGVVAMSVVFSAITSLLLARWWQSLLYNPGGFGSEFRALRLGRTAAAVTLGISALALFTTPAWIDSLALVVAAVYVFQGLAVAHGVVNGLGLGPGWLVALYVALVPLMIYVVVGLMIVGAVDAWADYRRRVQPGGNG
jgi:hypothetical protein